MIFWHLSLVYAFLAPPLGLWVVTHPVRYLHISWNDTIFGIYSDRDFSETFLSLKNSFFTSPPAKRDQQQATCIRRRAMKSISVLISTCNLRYLAE